MNQANLKRAFIDRSSEQIKYSGSAEEGLCIELGLDDFLTVLPEQIIEILAIMAKYNPLLDDSNAPDKSSSSLRFSRWIAKESQGYFGRQLTDLDALRIRGVFGAEWILKSDFNHDAGMYRVGSFPHANPVTAFKECEGRICIFREGGLFLRTKLARVKGKDDSVWLTLDVLDAPGFSSFRKQIKVGSSFDYLSIRHGYVVTSLPSWTLVTGDALVEHLTAFAATLPDKQDIIAEFHQMMRRADHG
jgi:hypothetical protein